jgi:hypothetical protein
VAEVVWSIRESPKAVMDSTRQFLRYFGFAALAFSAPNVQMISELTNKKEKRTMNNMRRTHYEQ